MPDIKAGGQLKLDDDEAGLWMRMDRLEKALRSSGRLVKAPALNTYLREVAFKVAGPHCSDIRVYLVQIPQFNASMAINGAILVWSGLFLRVQNEAQLAYILSHEIGHYMKRHSVQAMRDICAKGTFVQSRGRLVDASGAVKGIDAGVGAAWGQLAGIGVQTTAQLAALGSFFAFSRDNEREADEIAFELMVNAGYDSREAPKVWEALIKERAAGKDNSAIFIFATHPNPEERVATLKELIKKTTPNEGSPVVGRESHLRAILPVRSALLRDELRQREFARSQVVLNRLFMDGAEPAELFFFQGELYRIRDEGGDLEKARAAYQAAIQIGQVSAEVYRGLGLVLWKMGDKDGGRRCFERYIQDRPQAEDREMIWMYIQQSEKDKKR